ncbi:trypsin-1 [Procambarus clarkii]|uniref:trypsin-1 n=1 Tax=Procambarus clarkii TaxID=6728 RepID=UPI003741E95E
MAAIVKVSWASLLIVSIFSTLTHSQSSNQCVDKDAQCKTWAARDYCSSHRENMANLCPATCNLCKAPRRSIANPDFVCGLPISPERVPTVPRRSIFPNNNRKQNAPWNAPPFPNFNGRRGSSSSNGGRRRARYAEPQLGVSQTVTTPQTSAGNPGQQQAERLKVEDTFCGATPISDRFLLTAAYCVVDHEHPLTTVRLGELDFSKDNETNSRPRDYTIETIIVHQDYDPSSPVRYNDIALLKTVEKIEFNEFVFPYCVSKERPPHNADVTGSGFGLVNETYQSPVLQEVDLKVMSSEECEEVFKKTEYEQQIRKAYPSLFQGKDIMCASYPGRGLCKGDEGGPLSLTVPKGRARYLVGIASFAGTCEKDTIMPSVFTSVADHIPFIDSVLYGP